MLGCTHAGTLPKYSRLNGSLFLGQALSGLITVLEDKEYMVTLREKMNNIKKVAKFYNYDLLLAKK
jgi:hypothetical protein